ncbi:MAG: cupredoxin family copper-binding protein [Dehalococcoidia bacterium]|nr:cupredoxin family copper-binding protein [Dehalococcoidia bacterium]
MPDRYSQDRSQRGSALAALPLIAAVVFGLAFMAGMLGVMAWWGGGDHMGMMGRGSSGADQTPVVSSADKVTVEIRDYEFFPARLTVDAGTEVTWVNRDNVPHNAVAGDGAFDTGRLDKDDSAPVTLDEPGTHPYKCTYHPDMAATVTVR